MPDFTAVFTQERDHWRDRAEAAEAELERERARAREHLDARCRAEGRSEAWQRNADGWRQRATRAEAEVERLRSDHHEFTARLGYGDGHSEPAAPLAYMVEPIEVAFSEARDHQECARICESCGETLASTVCPECHGSGSAPCATAYSECGHCGGSGWIHEGCAERSYADLAAEVERLRGALDGLIEKWRYKGEFGWGPWQAGEGPDLEGCALDHAASELRDVLRGDQ